MSDALKPPTRPKHADPAGPRHERRWSRTRRRLKVTLQHSPSFSVDVCPGGFCVELLRVLPPGAPVEGSVQVKGSEIPFAGRVAWSKPGIPHMGLRGRMGVRLTSCAPGWPAMLDV